MRYLVLCSLLVTGLLGSVIRADEAAPPAEPSSPDATLNFSGGVIAIGVGYGWGHGTLDYQGTTHRFRVHGLSVLDVGAANLTAQGEVYNLKSLADFAGNYVAASAGAAVAGGGSAAMLENEHGVKIRLTSTVVGLRFNLAAGGVRISLGSHHHPQG